MTYYILMFITEDDKEYEVARYGKLGILGTHLEEGDAIKNFVREHGNPVIKSMRIDLNKPKKLASENMMKGIAQERKLKIAHEQELEDWK